MATVIAAALSIPLGVLAFVFLPVLLVASIPLGLYLMLRKSEAPCPKRVASVSSVQARQAKRYALISPRRLLSNYKSYHLN
ncbi:MAG: hypothetical protein RMM16_11030 [Chloroherpetonaceae bacterium]|nr:hypothetical protein [Chloroherpetonaceae bacterium]